MTLYKIIRSNLYRGDMLIHTVYYRGHKVRVAQTSKVYSIENTTITLQPVYDCKTDRLIGFTD